MEEERRVFTASISNDGNVPSEIRLFQSGINHYSDGDKILFDEEAAESVMKRYREKGIDLMADYEHMSLQRPPIEAPASAKKWVPEVRGGDLIASSIGWTERAKSMIAAGEYRYYSVACKVDPKTGRCMEMINFALTNNPAAVGIAPLKAASAIQVQSDPPVEEKLPREHARLRVPIISRRASNG